MELKTTSDTELKDLASRMGIDVQIVSSDQIPKSFKTVNNLIINVDPISSGRGGSHWVCLHIDHNNKTVVYFDPFGMEPQPSVMTLIHKAKKAGYTCMYITNDSQDIRSESCGYWCLYFLYRINRGDKLSAIITDLDKTPKQNEKMLAKFFSG